MVPYKRTFSLFTWPPTNQNFIVFTCYPTNQHFIVYLHGTLQTSICLILYDFLGFLDVSRFKRARMRIKMPGLLQEGLFEDPGILW
jgi:hypothetical protein